MSVLGVFLASLLLAAVAPARAAGGGCAAERFSSNRVYAACSDLPHLGASVHWTYDAAASASLSVAFVAAPPSPGGWVAWGSTDRRRDGRHAGARRAAQGGRRRVRGPDVRHRGVLALRAGEAQVPGDRPRRGGRRRRPRQRLREAGAAERHRRGEPGLAGRAGLQRVHGAARHEQRQQGRHGEAQPPHRGSHLFRRRRQQPQEEECEHSSILISSIILFAFLEFLIKFECTNQIVVRKGGRFQLEFHQGT